VSRKIGREVLRLLVGKELLSPEWAERILSLFSIVPPTNE